MTTIDSRVVEMRFDNKQFESGVKSTLSSLLNLNRGLQLKGATKGLGDIGSAAKNINLDNISKGVQDIAGRFSAMSVVAVTALATIANKAVNAGLTLAKSFTIDPVQAGLGEYETNLNSIQTILANTGLSGKKGLDQVTGALNELNTYSDQTIYNFSEMARNIGTFTSAGVKLGPATAAIKGIANLAAVSGSSAVQASTAMYQMSQALASGKVTLQDWNSVVTAGMGGKVFQESLKETARTHGVAVDKIIKKEGSFRDSLKTGWLSSKILTETLSKFTGDLTDKQLKQMGYTDKQIAGIQKMAKTARDAAQKVKTASQLIGTLQEAAGSGWSNTFAIVIGNFDEARTMFTNVNNVLSGMITNSAAARNKVLGDWKLNGGRDAAIKAVSNAFYALLALMKPVQDAFRQVFPPITGKRLAEITKTIEKFTEKLKIGGGTADKIKRTFAGLFSVFSIGVAIIKGVAHFLLSLFSIAGKGSGGILSLTATAGDFLVKIREWLVEGKGIENFFNILIKARDTVLKPLITFVSLLVSAFADLLHGDTKGFGDGIKKAFGSLSPIVDKVKASFDSFIQKIAQVADAISSAFKGLESKVSGPVLTAFHVIEAAVDAVRNKISGMIPKVNASGLSGATAGMSAANKIGARASLIWNGVVNAFNTVKKALGPIVSKVGDFFGEVGKRIAEYIRGLTFQDAVALLNTGFFIALYVAFRKFIGNMREVFSSASDAFKSAGGVFDGLTSSLKTMQQGVKADIILKIAVAVGLLAASLYILSTIQPAKMAAALGGVAALMAILVVSMGRVLDMTKAIQGPAIAGSAKILAVGGAVVLLALSVLILSAAVKVLSGLSWQEMAKGLIAVGILLNSLALFTRMAEVNKGSIGQAAGLILLGIAIKLLADSVQTLGKMKVSELVKGIATISLMFDALAIMTKVMSGTTGMVQAAAGLLILSAALAAMSLVIRIYAAIDWGTMVKGLTLMIVTLGGLGIALRLFPPGLPAIAVGLLLVAGALVIISKVLKTMGAMSVGEIVKSIIVLSLSLDIIIASVTAMIGALPGAAALIVVSAALLIYANAMAILGHMSWGGIAKGFVAIVAILIVLGLAAALIVPLIPVLASLAVVLLALGLACFLAGAGVSLFAVGFALLASVGAAGFAVLLAGFASLMALLPLFAQQVGLAMIAFASVIGNAGPIVVDALTKILISLLTAIQNIIPKLVDTIGILVVSMTNKVVQLSPLLFAAGLKLIMGFLTAVGNKVQIITQLAIEIIVRFLNTIAANLGRIVAAGISIMVNFLNGIANNLPKVVTAGVNIIVKLLNGIANNLPRIIAAGLNIVVKFCQAIGNAGGTVTDAAASMVIKFVNGVANSIRSHSGEMRSAGLNLASAIIDGMTGGLASGLGRVVSSAANVARSAFNAAKAALGVNSPSKEFAKLGMYSSQGLAVGLEDYSNVVENASAGVGKAAILAMSKSISGMSELISQDVDMNPTITPVLDLSLVKQAAMGLDGLMGTAPISVDASFSQAKNVSSSLVAPTPVDGTDAMGQLRGGSTNQYTQIINAPSQPSAIDLYRHTKNLLSMTKGGN